MATIAELEERVAALESALKNKLVGKCNHDWVSYGVPYRNMSKVICVRCGARDVIAWGAL